jgi:hypothetical protein
MAAVALLGILYSVLARAAIEGLRAEGESERRLEASLLADSRLAETFNTLEGSVALPPLGHSEVTEGDFTIALDVTMFQAPVEWELAGSERPPPLLFASAPGAPGARALRTVELTVSWLEAGAERHVSRTMFLVDFMQLGAIAAAMAPAPQAPGENAGDDLQAPDGNTDGSPGAGQVPDVSDLPSELELP